MTIAEDPRCFEAPQPPPDHGDRLLRFVRGRAATPGLWTDAWLAALADGLGYELTTFDKGYRALCPVRLRLLEL